MSDDMVRCSACGTPHGSIEDATVCCEKDKPGVVGRWCPLATGPPKVLCYEWNTEMRCEDCVIKQGADE